MLARLRAAGIHVWIEGGWGVDALLGEQTRPHDDLDLGVRFEDVESICEALAEFERSDNEWPSSFVLRDMSGRKVDCHPLRFDENGDGWQSNRSGGLLTVGLAKDLSAPGASTVSRSPASRRSYR